MQALKQCPAVEVVSPHAIKILMKGEEVIVRLSLPEGKRISKKEVQSLTKQVLAVIDIDEVPDKGK